MDSVPVGKRSDKESDKIRLNFIYVFLFTLGSTGADMT